MKHYLNECNTIYAILSLDYEVNVFLNTMMFAMSLKEREKLNENGKTSNRLRWYKIVKWIAKYFIPRLQKRVNCKYRQDSLLPSFCLKNTVLHMIENYPCNNMWTDGYLIINTLFEIGKIYIALQQIYSLIYTS